VIFVAQVDVDRVDAHGPCRDDGAFEKTVRVAFEVVPILERARFALVDVDGHQTRRGFRGHDLPLAAGGEAGATETAQSRVLHDPDHVADSALTVDARGGQRISTAGAVRGVIDVRRCDRRIRRVVLYRRGSDARDHLVRSRVRHRVLTHYHDRRRLAPADARRMEDAHVFAE
jgi:hypothetical protein